ncbi:Hypothetical_protein [Hexamita inflata]|uniref:Hypothetical_protein n=1 Tax=Hexamita inflata TaxID=28002 RepID=A0AA86U0R9_9EUKA|nr:Hypothetical protein HINF_LOCUS21767 [Hexamita inflata]
MPHNHGGGRHGGHHLGGGHHTGGFSGISSHHHHPGIGFGVGSHHHHIGYNVGYGGYDDDLDCFCCLGSRGPVINMVIIYTNIRIDTVVQNILNKQSQNIGRLQILSSIQYHISLSQLILFFWICYFFKATFFILFKNSLSVAKSSGPAKLFSGSNLSQLSGSTSVPLMRTFKIVQFRYCQKLLLYVLLNIHITLVKLFTQIQASVQHLQIFWTSPQKMIFQCYLEVKIKFNELQIAQMQISVFPYF